MSAEVCRALECTEKVGPTRPFCGYHWAMLGLEQKEAVHTAQALKLKGKPRWWLVAVASAISHIARHEAISYRRTG